MHALIGPVSPPPLRGQAAAPCVVWKNTTEIDASNRPLVSIGANNDAKARRAFAGLPILEAANVTHMTRNAVI